MNIVQDPHPTLYVVSTEVPADQIKQVARTAQKALALLKRTKNGVGLAANQVGETQRWFVSQVFKVCINPEIIEASEEMETATEGCLSKPGFETKRKRHAWMKVRWIAKNGKMMNRTIRGFPARIFQHEIDHLNGKNIWR